MHITIHDSKTILKIYQNQSLKTLNGLGGYKFFYYDRISDKVFKQFYFEYSLYKLFIQLN